MIVELGLEATPLNVNERQLCHYNGKLLRDVMRTLLQSFTRAEFLEAERDRLPSNLGKFCFMLVDRCRTNIFPNGARPVFRFFVQLLEKLEGDHHSATSLRAEGRSMTLTGPNPNLSRDPDLVPIFKALNRVIILLLGNKSYGSEGDLLLTFNRIIHNQKIVFSPINTDHEFIFCLCFHLYKYLLADKQELRDTALNVYTNIVESFDSL